MRILFFFHISSPALLTKYTPMNKVPYARDTVSGINWVLKEKVGRNWVPKFRIGFRIIKIYNGQSPQR